MKKKTTWKTVVGLAAATVAFLRLVPAAPDEKKPDETPKEYCIRDYGNLTWYQYQIKLNELDEQYALAQVDPDNPPFLDRAIYDARHYGLTYCRNQQKLPIDPGLL